MKRSLVLQVEYVGDNIDEQVICSVVARTPAEAFRIGLEFPVPTGMSLYCMSACTQGQWRMHREHPSRGDFSVMWVPKYG